MSKIISVHSFRGGTGKSNTSANVAALLAADGRRVAVIDTDIQSPGVHVLFGFKDEKLPRTLNDYLWGRCTIEEAAIDVTSRLGAAAKGKLFLIPSSIEAAEIARILRESYDVGLLNDGFLDVVERMNLDVLVIDTHPGVNEETLLSISISDVLALIMRPDQQDFQGTAVTIEVAKKLDVARMVLVVNKVPTIYKPEDVQRQIEETFNVEVGAVIPHSDDLMVLASAGVFVLRFPNHPLTAIYKQLAANLIR
jgi:MinD-like ATPase involved in chromosome partitioning or flagellar assembly